jgi:hypothetical protein
MYYIYVNTYTYTYTFFQFQFFFIRLKAISSEEYKDPVIQILSNFITDETVSNIDKVNWEKPKIKKISLESLARKLEIDLIKTEWFVTGACEPQYFSDDFIAQNPNIMIKGIKEYAIGVNKLFSQKDARAEIIAVRKSETAENTVTGTHINLYVYIYISKPTHIYTVYMYIYIMHVSI